MLKAVKEITKQTTERAENVITKAKKRIDDVTNEVERLTQDAAQLISDGTNDAVEEFIEQDPLIEVIKEQDYYKVKEYLDAHPKRNLNIPNEFKELPLLIAAQYENSAISELLIERGAKIDIRNTNYETVFAIAYNHENNRILPKLVEELNNLDKEQFIDLLVKKGKEDSIAKIIFEDANDNTINNFINIAKGKLGNEVSECFKFLFDDKTNTLYRDDYLITLTLENVKNGSDLYELLSYNKRGLTPSHYLIKEKRFDAAINLINQAKRTCTKDDFLSLFLLTDNRALTVFHYAIQSGNDEFLQQVIEAIRFGKLTRDDKRAILESLNDNNEHALHIAVSGKNEQIVSYIIAYAQIYIPNEREFLSFINAPDKLGNTPLHIAMIPLKKEIYKQLLEAGAHVDAENKAGIPPLQIAAYNHVEAAWDLVKNYDADFSKCIKKDKDGKDIPLIEWIYKNYQNVDSLNLYIQKNGMFNVFFDNIPMSDKLCGTAMHLLIGKYPEVHAIDPQTKEIKYKGDSVKIFQRNVLSAITCLFVIGAAYTAHSIYGGNTMERS